MKLGMDRDRYSMYLGHELGGMVKHYAGKKPEILLKVARAIQCMEPGEAAWRDAMGICAAPGKSLGLARKGRS